MCNKVGSSFEIMTHEWVAVGCTGNRLLLNITGPLAYSTYVVEKLVLYIVQGLSTEVQHLISYFTCTP